MSTSETTSSSSNWMAMIERCKGRGWSGGDRLRLHGFLLHATDESRPDDAQHHDEDKRDGDEEGVPEESGERIFRVGGVGAHNSRAKKRLFRGCQRQCGHWKLRERPGSGYAGRPIFIRQGRRLAIRGEFHTTGIHDSPSGRLRVRARPFAAAPPPTLCLRGKTPHA